MIRALQNSLWAYFFDREDNLQIYHSARRDINSSSLRQFRLYSWILMSLVYFWQVIISKSLFIEVQFLTLHAVFLAWLYFGLVSVQPFLYDSNGTKGSPKLKYWVGLIYEAAAVLQIPVTLIYWFLMFPYDLTRLKTRHLILFILQHTVPVVLLAIDFFYNRFRFKANRLLLILAYTILYMILNAVYTFSARPVYPMLKWKDFMTFGYTLGMFVVLIASYYGLQQLAAIRNGEKISRIITKYQFKDMNVIKQEHLH